MQYSYSYSRETTQLTQLSLSFMGVSRRHVFHNREHLLNTLLSIQPPESANHNPPPPHTTHTHQINCAARVGDNSAWLASGSQKSAQITIVECVTPAPLVLESFNVESSRIIAIMYVPPATHCDTTLTATMKRVSLRDTLRNMGTLTNLPPHLATVWMGAECGK